MLLAPAEMAHKIAVKPEELRHILSFPDPPQIEQGQARQVVQSRQAQQELVPVAPVESGNQLKGNGHVADFFTRFPIQVSPTDKLALRVVQPILEASHNDLSSSRIECEAMPDLLPPLEQTGNIGKPSFLQFCKEVFRKKSVHMQDQKLICPIPGQDCAAK